MMNLTVPVEELLHRFTYYDYAVFIVMLVISGALGLWCAFNGGPQNTIRQLLAADGKLPPVLVSTSLMASFISASYILGNVSEIYTHGTMYFYILLSYCLCIPITASFYMPVFYNSGVLTCYEYLELRFNRAVRCIAVFFYVIQMLIYISIQLYAPALALSYVTGMGLWDAVIAIGVICTIYTSVGGIKAVVYTDSFQAVCMILAMTIVVVLGFNEIGGFAHAWEVAKRGKRVNFDDASLDPTVRHTIWGLLIGSFFTNAASYATNQMMVLRYFTVSSMKRAKLVVWGNLPYLAIILILSCLSGLMTYAFFAECDPVEAKQIQSNDQLLPYFVMVVLGKRTGIPGVFVAGIFAASLSSISSGVNSLANVFYVDVVALIWPNISNETGSRIINVLGAACGLLSIALVYLAQQMGDVLSATNAINSGIGGPLLGLFSVAMFVPFVNTKGAMSGLIISLAISLWLNIGQFLAPPPIIPAAPPLSVDQCQDVYMRANNLTEFVELSDEWVAPDGFLDIYRISYIWFTAISFVITFVVAIPVSLLTTPNDPKSMNPNYICKPFDIMCPWLSEETRAWLSFYVGVDHQEDKTSWDIKLPEKAVQGNDNAAYLGSFPNLSAATNHDCYKF